MTGAKQFATSARRSGPEAAVPSCPGWTVNALERHQLRVYRWATSVITGEDRDESPLPEPADLPDALVDGADRVRAALKAAPATLDVETFLPGSSPRLFWARRMAHETAIHRVDAELAAGYGVTPAADDFATDGIDELLLGFVPTRLSDITVDKPFTITIEPLDVNAGWTVAAGQAGATAYAGASDDSELTVFGAVSALYLWLWNRSGDDEVSLSGQMTLADVWHHRFVVKAR
jgi:uncharacterized protein (TIGR03083 family)